MVLALSPLNNLKNKSLITVKRCISLKKIPKADGKLRQPGFKKKPKFARKNWHVKEGKYHTLEK